MVKQIFINLPVQDLQKTMDFWKALGFTFNPQFTDQNAACLELSGKDGPIYAMLLKKEFFGKFTTRQIADTSSVVEVLNSMSFGSREEIDGLVQKALSAGGKEFRAAEDYGWMYNRNFQDLDGHAWELIYMDMSKAPANPGQEQGKADFKPPQA